MVVAAVLLALHVYVAPVALATVSFALLCVHIRRSRVSLCNRLPSNSPGLTYIGAYAFQCVCRLKLYPRLVITLDIVLRGNSIRHQCLLSIRVLTCGDMTRSMCHLTASIKQQMSVILV